MRNTTKTDLQGTFRNDLAANAITEDGKLLPLRTLAERYDSSPATVKRMVDKLVAEGVLRTIHGVGIFMVQGEIRPIPVLRPHIGAIVLDDQIQVELKLAREMYMEKGWAFSIYNASSDKQSPAREKTFLNMVRHQEFAAVIMEATPIEPTNSELFCRLRNCGIKVIHMSPYREDMRHDSYFMPDFYAAGQVTVGQLVRRQYRHAVICHDKPAAPFLQAWTDGITMMAGQLDLELAGTFEQVSPERVLEELREPMRRGKTAVICANSDLAEELADMAAARRMVLARELGIIALSPATDRADRISYLDFDYAGMVDDAMAYATNGNIDSLTLVQKKYLPFYVNCNSI